MSRFILGHGQSDGWALIAVDEPHAARSPIYFTQMEARWLHAELGRQLGVADEVRYLTQSARH